METKNKTNQAKYKETNVFLTSGDLYPSNVLRYVLLNPQVICSLSVQHALTIQVGQGSFNL